LVNIGMKARPKGLKLPFEHRLEYVSHEHARIPE